MIRKYNESEIPELLEIWEKAALIAHPFLTQEFHEMVKELMKNKFLPNSDTWVYAEGGVIIGFISMNGNEIGGLFVNPGAQSKGVGTSLVNHQKELHNELEVEVFQENKIGVPFYKKNGFSIIKNYVMEGADQVVLRMKKN